MKKTIIAMLGLVLASAIVVLAANTYDDSEARTRPSNVLRNTDFSDYPSSEGQHGTIIRYYDFSVDGGAVGSVSLERGVGRDTIPSNTVIVGGYVQMLTPVTPATSTNTINIASSGDIMAGAASTSLFGAVTAIYPITPAWSASTAVIVHTNAPLTFTIAGNAVTQGAFKVVLDCYRSK